jgi:hypothetical protein
MPVPRGPLPSPCHRFALVRCGGGNRISMRGFVVGGRGIGKGGKARDFGGPLLSTYEKFRRRVTPADENHKN